MLSRRNQNISSVLREYPSFATPRGLNLPGAPGFGMSGRPKSQRASANVRETNIKIIDLCPVRAHSCKESEMELLKSCFSQYTCNSFPKSFHDAIFVEFAGVRIEVKGP